MLIIVVNIRDISKTSCTKPVLYYKMFFGQIKFHGIVLTLLTVFKMKYIRLLICESLFLFTAMAESRMSNYWVGLTTLPRVWLLAELVVFVPQLPLWTLSLHQRHTTQNTCWMNALLPPSTMSRLQYHQQRVRPRPAHHQPVLATQVLRPP